MFKSPFDWYLDKVAVTLLVCQYIEISAKSLYKTHDNFMLFVCRFFKTLIKKKIFITAECHRLGGLRSWDMEPFL